MAAYYTINMYPVQFKVDYPDRPLDRVSTLLRVLYFIPIFMVIAAISGVGFDFQFGKWWAVFFNLGGFVDGDNTDSPIEEIGDVLGGGGLILFPMEPM